MGDDDEGWTVATGKASHGQSSRMRKRRHAPPTRHATGTSQTEVTENAITRALESVATSLDTLRGHAYASNVPSKLPEHVAQTKNYWVWGLGSLDNPSQAQLVRYQVSMALLLSERLPELTGPPETVDPVFTKLDVAVYERLGFATQTGNHDWTIHEPTMLFAPHLEQVFTTRLLRTTREQGTAEEPDVHRKLNLQVSRAQPRPDVPHQRRRDTAGKSLCHDDRDPPARAGLCCHLSWRIQRPCLTLLCVSIEHCS